LDAVANVKGSLVVVSCFHVEPSRRLASAFFSSRCFRALCCRARNDSKPFGITPLDDGVAGAGDALEFSGSSTRIVVERRSRDVCPGALIFGANVQSRKSSSTFASRSASRIASLRCAHTRERSTKDPDFFLYKDAEISRDRLEMFGANVHDSNSFNSSRSRVGNVDARSLAAGFASFVRCFSRYFFANRRLASLIFGANDVSASAVVVFTDFATPLSPRYSLSDAFAIASALIVFTAPTGVSAAFSRFSVAAFAAARELAVSRGAAAAVFAAAPPPLAPLAPPPDSRSSHIDRTRNFSLLRARDRVIARQRARASTHHRVDRIASHPSSRRVLRRVARRVASRRVAAHITSHVTASGAPRVEGATVAIARVGLNHHERARAASRRPTDRPTAR
jgi:hypothetical protein